MDLDPPRAATLGALAGTVVAAVGVVGEAWARGLPILELQTSSVTVWIVETLPLMLGLAGWGVAERNAPTETVSATAPRAEEPAAAAEAQPPPAPLPVANTPPPAPAYVPTPAPVPRRGELRTKTVEAPPRLVVDPRLRGERLLYVDAHPDAPAVVSELQQAGLTVVHVGDAASGSLAREAERITLAAVDPEAPGAEALVSELLRFELPVVRLGMATLTTTRQRTVPRPIEPSAVARALAELLD